MTTIQTDLPRTAASSFNALMAGGGLEAALAETEAEVRQRPGHLPARWLLFDLLCLNGQWTRAVKQLQAVAGLDGSRTDEVNALRLLVVGEEFRTEVFAGRRRPAADEPPAWLETLLDALAAQAQARDEAADALREQAFDQAPETPGAWRRAGDRGEFSWLADSDSRLGPVLEVFSHGRYEWIPFERVQSLRLSAPACPRDIMWLPARLSLPGRDSDVFLPVRYPGSEQAAAPLRLGRETVWTERGRTGVIGLGHKIWCTDTGRAPAFEVREMRFGNPAA